MIAIQLGWNYGAYNIYICLSIIHCLHITAYRKCLSLHIFFTADEHDNYLFTWRKITTIKNILSFHYYLLTVSSACRIQYVFINCDTAVLLNITVFYCFTVNLSVLRSVLSS